MTPGRHRSSPAELARLLAAFDGNLTILLEHYVGSAIRTTRVRHRLVPPPAGSGLHDGGSRQVLRRDAVLTSSSAATLVVARSYIELTGLPSEVRRELHGGREPIGRIISRHRWEVFREVVHSRPLEPGGSDGTKPGPDALVVERMTRLWAKERPVMEITELFTRSCLSRFA